MLDKHSRENSFNSLRMWKGLLAEKKGLNIEDEDIVKGAEESHDLYQKYRKFVSATMHQQLSAVL